VQGQHKYQPKLFVQIDIEKLIPQNHFLRKIDQILDLSFVRELTKEYYCQNNGRPSIDPELFFRIILIGYIFNISSDRKLCEELRYNLAYRWYCKLEIDDFTPDHSSLSRIRDRYEASVFEKFFDKVVDLCKDYGLVHSTPHLLNCDGNMTL
jgi:transposase